VLLPPSPGTQNLFHADTRQSSSPTNLLYKDWARSYFPRFGMASPALVT
jgi:hypothetical protein